MLTETEDVRTPSTACESIRTADEIELIILAADISALPASPTTPFTKTSRKKITSSRCAVNLDGKPRAPPPTNSTTKASSRVVQAATALTRVQEPDADLLPMPDRSASIRPGPAVARAYFETAITAARERAEASARWWMSLRSTISPRPASYSTRTTRRGHRQFARPERLSHADVGGNFHHHAGDRLLRMAKSELAGCSRSRSAATGRNRSRKAHRIRQASAGTCHRANTPSFSSPRRYSTWSDSCSTTWADRPFSMSVRSSIIGSASETLRRQHHHRRQCLSSAAIGRSLRWRRRRAQARASW